MGPKAGSNLRWHLAEPISRGSFPPHLDHSALQTSEAQTARRHPATK